MLLAQQPTALVSGGGISDYQHHTLLQQQQHHQVNLEVGGLSGNYNATPAYTTNSDSAQHHDATSLYYQQLADGSSSNSSYSNLITPCDYSGQPYCPPHASSEYSGQYQQTPQQLHYASAVLPSETQSSGYYSNGSMDQHYSSCCPAQQPDAMIVPSTYDCYSNGSTNLEVKYQAAFVDAMESTNSSMDTSVAASSSDLSAVDPLVLHHHHQQQQQQQPSEFHYEYETNYGNNEWTMTSNYSYPTESYASAAIADPSVGIRPSANDVNMEMPNYCFAASCVFSTTPPLSSSAKEEPVEMVLSGTYSSPNHVAGASVMRHFESYDYATLADELHPALWEANENKRRLSCVCLCALTRSRLFIYIYIYLVFLHYPTVAISLKPVLHIFFFFKKRLKQK